MNLKSLSLGAGEVLLTELALGRRLPTAALSSQEERKRLQSQGIRNRLKQMLQNRYHRTHKEQPS